MLRPLLLRRAEAATAADPKPPGMAPPPSGEQPGPRKIGGDDGRRSDLAEAGMDRPKEPFSLLIEDKVRRARRNAPCLLHFLKTHGSEEVGNLRAGGVSLESSSQARERPPCPDADI